MSYRLRSMRDGRGILDNAPPGYQLKRVTIHFDSTSSDTANGPIYHCVQGSAKEAIVVLDEKGDKQTIADVPVEF